MSVRPRWEWVKIADFFIVTRNRLEFSRDCVATARPPSAHLPMLRTFERLDVWPTYGALLGALVECRFSLEGFGQVLRWQVLRNEKAPGGLNAAWGGRQTWRRYAARCSRCGSKQ